MTEHLHVASSVGHFSEVLGVPVGGGTLAFIAGQVGFAEDGTSVVAGGVGPETRAIFDQIDAHLAALGGGLADVVRMTVYLTDLADYAEFAAVRAELFPEAPPASAAVGVADLLLGARIEIEGTAFLGDAR